MVDEKLVRTPEIYSAGEANQRSKEDVERSTLNLWTHLMMEVDPLQATAPLAAFCFMTGFMSVCYIYNSNSLLALSSVMRSPSLPFSYGVGFKLETLPRCASFVLSLNRLTNLDLISSHSPSLDSLKVPQTTATRHSTRPINKLSALSSHSTQVLF